MGNTTSCCVGANSSYNNGQGDSYHQESGGTVPHDTSATNLPHIADREHQDWDADPSLHPSAWPLFIERSQILQSKLFVND